MANTKITTNVIADDAITTAKIADDAVTQAKIADDAVGSDQLAGSLTADINGGSIDGTPIGASSASTVVATQVDITAEGDIRLQDASGGQYVGFDAPSTVASSLTWTLPAADGTANYLLKTDGAGALGWAAAGLGKKIGKILFSEDDSNSKNIKNS